MNDVINRVDIDDIVSRFYQAMLQDPIIGYIFTDVAKIDLESHLPIIGDFWEDALFGSDLYQRNTMQKHLEIHDQLPLTPGHFTRWLFLFEQAVNTNHHGENAIRMLKIAERVAKTIAAALSKQKRTGLTLSLKELS